MSREVRIQVFGEENDSIIGVTVRLDNEVYATLTKAAHTLREARLDGPRGAIYTLYEDDVLDAVVSGILYFLDNSTPKVFVKQLNYLRR